MRRPLLASLLLLAAPLALVACDTGGPDPIGITGTWEGTVTNRLDTTESFPITLRLTDNGLNVNGSGVVQLPDDDFEFQVVNGSFVQGQVQLPLQFARPPFTGQISGGLTETDPAVIEGTISASGLANGPLEVELVARRVS